MSRRSNSIVVLLSLLAALQIQGAEGPNICSCGLQSSTKVTYSGPAFDDFRVGASVTAISKNSNGETIQIDSSIPIEEGRLQSARFQTANFGRTWKKEGTTSSELLQFSRPPIQYRLPLAGESLEVSFDNGAHWRKALMQVGQSPESGESGHAAVASPSHWRLELAAIHPMNPHTIYGCISPVPRAETSLRRSQDETRRPGIYISMDSGDHWSLFSDDFHRRALEEPCLLGINPYDPSMMLLHGRSGLLITSDEGKTWAPVGEQKELEEPARLKGYAEASKRLESKGIIPPKQWPFDWTYLALTSIAFDSSNRDVIYLVSNKGLYITRDHARSWCLVLTGNNTLFSVGPIFVDDTKPGRIFVSVASDILVSEDRGCHFKTFLDSTKLPSQRQR
jgi:hypothetical protein